MDNSGEGAGWVFTRSGSTWTQQGSKLVGTGAVGSAGQGSSVGISADGNTAIVGGAYDKSDSGAVWVYTRSTGSWTQEGSKLVGAGHTGGAYQGCSGSLSSDGNTVIVGGDYDNSNVGAVWIFTSCINPGLPVPGTSSSVNCGKQSTSLSIVSGTLNSATNWEWYSGSCGGTSVGSGTPVAVSPDSTTIYYARAEGGCVTPGACASITVKVIPLLTPAICTVTVDSLSQYNVILWTKPVSAGIKSYLVYRDTANNNFAIIGEVPADSLSQFIDTVRTLYAANGDPNASTWKYAIAIKDSCGSIGPLSPYHKSLFIQNSAGNFSWNDYLIQGQATPIPELSNYLFQRDNFSNGTWVTIQTLSASSLSYTDAAYLTYQNTASWRVLTKWSISCTPTYRLDQKATTTNGSKSNHYFHVSPLSAGAASLGNELSVFPNPGNGAFTVQCSRLQIQAIDVYTLIGERVYADVSLKTGTFAFALSLPNGVYFAHFITEKGMAVKTIVINN